MSAGETSEARSSAPAGSKFPVVKKRVPSDNVGVTPAVVQIHTPPETVGQPRLLVPWFFSQLRLILLADVGSLFPVV